ncbi:hypothetical protein [Arenibacter arenosicollis]|uniref:hypothetical protein n=1 Tax=Arenibacter arenosicollis TaxID=2762274 RepID=UPI001CA3C831|nr:hypothetical protein [Arenibacter arenosicollis]
MDSQKSLIFLFIYTDDQAYWTVGMSIISLGYLLGGRQLDYPPVLEHDGHLLLAFQGMPNKK